jgi:hypothetical protein
MESKMKKTQWYAKNEGSFYKSRVEDGVEDEMRGKALSESKMVKMKN